MFLEKLGDYVARLRPPWLSPWVIMWSIHLTIFALCGVLAFLVRFDLTLDPRSIDQILFAVPVWVVVKTIAYRMARLDRGWWRYVSIPDMLLLVAANLGASLVSGIVILFWGPVGFPRSIYIVDLMLCTYATGGVRLLARMMRDPATRYGGTRSGKRILLYGAGSAGFLLVREILGARRLDYDVRGFVDDNPLKKGMSVHLVPVLGAGCELAGIVKRQRIDEVLIAIPSASAEQMVRILSYCHDAGVRCKTVPTLGDLIEGRGLANQIRDVAVEDLLDRSTVHLVETGIRAKLEDSVVVVTGGAGSIGSELCRQIARFNPRAIVAYDISETGLFQLEQELRSTMPDLRLHCEVGSIQNRQRLADVFERYGPSILYHAAAYKHVPLMEAHLFEAVENNVLGTWNVATAAAAYGISDFVMISSDKAVRPTSVMGMTKRLAELLIHSLRGSGTKYVAVRFGNVLGSNGSVVPLLKKQIAAGGPVTVTHPDMERYFMTIPEAVQLVLQASTMGKGGETFVLDMGHPVKIVDLARNLILLSGLRPHTDIEIRFTGIRPGEKLFEEISVDGEDMLPTYHEKIKIFSGNGVPPEGMEPHIQAIRELCEGRDAGGLTRRLNALVPEYTPSTQVLSLSAADRRPPGVAGRAIAASAGQAV